MKRYYSPGESDSKSSEKGTSEDPPNDVTKQNEPGNKDEKKEEVYVPEKALEHYKESAEDTEE